MLIVCCLTASATAEEKFVSAAGGYSIVFHGKPTESEKQLKTPLGELTMRTAAFELKMDLGLRVIFVDYPDSMKTQKPEEILARARDGSKGVNDQMLDDASVKLNGTIPGREYLISKENSGFHRARIFLDGVRLYQVVVTGARKEDVLSPGADEFLKSFEIVR